MTPESLQIRAEFLKQRNSLLKSPEGKSNTRFLGHVFAKIAMAHIANNLPAGKYKVFLGPLWLKDLEWIEWDGAMIKKESKPIFQNYYEPNDIMELFEFKIAGIYGLKAHKEGQSAKTVKEVVRGIKDNFMAAQELGAAKNNCFYVSLHERKTKPEADLKKDPPINYYAEAKKIEANASTCILFNSSSFEKQDPECLDNWEEFIEKIKAALQ